MNQIGSPAASNSGPPHVETHADALAPPAATPVPQIATELPAPALPTSAPELPKTGA